MRAGIIVLKQLYEFVDEHQHDRLALYGKSETGRDYGEHCLECVKEVPPCQGFYLWGYFEKSGLWRNVYLGTAGKGKTASLRSRILEELKDERWFVWRSVFSEEDLAASGRMYYPKKWLYYKKSNFKRALAKVNSTHVVWVATELEAGNVLRVEADLIEAMNPSANLSRPSPPNTLQDDTKEIFALTRETIHRSRPLTKAGKA